MIRVRIELCPLGDERSESITEIGRMYIANDGTGTLDRGDYTVAVCRRGTSAVPNPIAKLGPCPSRGGAVLDFPRRAHNVWRLIARALHVAFPEESRPAKRKAGDRPVLDAGVIIGLRNGMNCVRHDHLTPDEQAAVDWLDAGTE